MYTFIVTRAASWQNQQSECAPSEESDQSGHPPSLISVFAVRTKKAWVLSYPLSAQRRLWSDWADAQADLSLRWAHSHIVGFVTSKNNLNYIFNHLSFNGFSVWLRDKPPDSPAQQIGMLDTVPDEETVDIPQGPTFSDPFFVQVFSWPLDLSVLHTTCLIDWLSWFSI